MLKQYWMNNRLKLSFSLNSLNNAFLHSEIKVQILAVDTGTASSAAYDVMQRLSVRLSRS